MIRIEWTRFTLRAAGIGLLGIVLALPLRGAEEEKGGKTFKTPGAATIYYEVRGGGPGVPLFLANGGPGFDHAYLHVSDIWDRIAESRPVVFWDQRGNGRSGDLPAGQSCTLADQVADLEALRAHLGYEKIDLLGHSWGGSLAMAYAARHPERIAHLVILDPAAPRWQETRYLFEDFALTLAGEVSTGDVLREYMSLLFVSPEKRDAFLAAAPSFAFRWTVNQALSADLARVDLNPELPKFRFPTLVGTGRHDFNVDLSTADRIHKAIPGSRFVVFERSGHLPFFEEPEAFRRALEEFLAGG